MKFWISYIFFHIGENPSFSVSREEFLGYYLKWLTTSHGYHSPERKKEGFLSDKWIASKVAGVERQTADHQVPDAEDKSGFLLTGSLFLGKDCQISGTNDARRRKESRDKGRKNTFCKKWNNEPISQWDLVLQWEDF